MDIRTKKIPAPKAPKAKIKGTKSKYKRPTFFEFLELELLEMEKTKMRKGSLKTFRKYATLLKKFALSEFPKKQLFTYEDVDWEFRLKLIDWMVDRNVQLSYGNKILKTLRQFLERAKRKKFHSNSDYQGAGWVIPEKKAKGTTVVFDLDELNHLATLELSGRMDKVRDICLIGAGTGQRYSDFSLYTPDNFYKTKSGIPILSVISTKTDTPCKVPLNIFPWLIPVLEKHNYQTPKMAIQKFNDGLKELAKLAGFDECVLVVEQYIGRRARVEKYYALKHDLVSSHICRRSFATSLYRMGYRLSQIMPMTGHATESQLRQYIGIDNEQNAEDIGLMILRQQKQGGSSPRLKIV